MTLPSEDLLETLGELEGEADRRVNLHLSDSAPGVAILSILPLSVTTSIIHQSATSDPEKKFA